MSTLAPERQGLITASLAPLIIHGSDAERFQLWLERTGQAEPEDLSDNFFVQWGKHNEPFVLDWFERMTQLEIAERQRFIKHPSIAWLGCTLDGYRPDDDAVIECKVLSPFTPSAEFVPYYAPQIAIQIACRGAGRGLLIAQQGNSPPQLYDVHADAAYRQGVLDLLAQFHQHILTHTPPGPPPKAPVPAERWRSVDLDAVELSNWGHAMKPLLVRWRETRAVAKEHEQAKTDIKVLLPDDVGRVTHGSFVVKRNRTGAVTIEEKVA